MLIRSTGRSHVTGDSRNIILSQYSACTVIGSKIHMCTKYEVIIRFIKVCAAYSHVLAL